MTVKGKGRQRRSQKKDGSRKTRGFCVRRKRTGQNNPRFMRKTLKDGSREREKNEHIAEHNTEQCNTNTLTQRRTYVHKSTQRTYLHKSTQRRIQVHRTTHIYKLCSTRNAALEQPGDTQFPYNTTGSENTARDTVAHYNTAAIFNVETKMYGTALQKHRHTLAQNTIP